MSTAKVHVVMHDQLGMAQPRPVPGIENKVHPFYGYVLGNRGISASGQTENEVIDRIKEAVLVNGLSSPRKVFEVDIGDHIVVHDVMNR